jgi:hypothetical protein
MQFLVTDQCIGDVAERQLDGLPVALTHYVAGDLCPDVGIGESV